MGRSPNRKILGGETGRQADAPPELSLTPFATANYLRGEEGLDVLFAHRPIARQLLATADERDTPMGRLRVISAEGLVAFKLQGYINDPARTRDLDDIRALLRAHQQTLDREELRAYFRLFEQEDLFDALIDELRD